MVNHTTKRHNMYGRKMAGKSGKGSCGERGGKGCYRKVKARYKVFPSAYASGAIAKCRKVGAANWGKRKNAK
jgi:hypothetical protein